MKTKKYNYFTNKCIDCGAKCNRQAKRCRKCADKQHSSRIKGKNHPNFKGGKPKCKVCGKELSYYKGTTCNRCRDRQSEKNPNFGNKWSIQQKNKARLFAFKTYDKFPEIKILISEHHADVSGKNNPNYKDGLNLIPYPTKFNKKLKNKIRQRDNFKCQLCNMTEEEHLQIIGTVLPIHHIDYNKKNCQEDNLISLCNKCNSKVNFNRDYWTEYFYNKVEA